jgi:hypothetical protein
MGAGGRICIDSMRPQSRFPSISRVPLARVTINQNNPLREKPDAE